MKTNQKNKMEYGYIIVSVKEDETKIEIERLDGSKQTYYKI